MKAKRAQLTSARTVRIVEVELVPDDDEVLIQIVACGVCRGDIRCFASSTRPVELMGHEPVGEIIETGKRVQRFRVGDWVVGTLYGSMGSHLVAKEDELWNVPKELGETACLAEPVKCVTTVVRTAAPDFRDQVAVVGCGFMGLCAVAALARTWHRCLIAIDPLDSRRDLALAVGATDAIDPSAGDPVGEVRELTDGAGVEVAVEFAGTTEAANLAAEILCKRGRLALGGGQSVSTRVFGSAAVIHHVPPAYSKDEGDDFRRAIDAMASGVYPLRKLISHRFELDRLQQAFEEIIASSGEYLKGIVTPE